MITVVTPTIRGREDLLAECAESVRRLRLPHLVELDEDGVGPAVIRNRLAARVTTDWVVFLDDDDLLLRNFVMAVRPHLTGDADVVYTDWHLTGAGAPWPLDDFDAERLTVENFIPVTACVRVAAFRKVGGFPDVPFEDHGLWKALLAAGSRFVHVPQVAWWYRRRPGSRLEMVGGR